MSKLIEMVCEVCGKTWDAIAVNRYDDGEPEQIKSLCRTCFEARA